MSNCTCGEFDNKIGVVGLYFRLVRSLISHHLPAPLAFMDNDITALCVGFCFYRAQDSAAVILSVTGIYINVERAKTKWAVIT